MTRKHFAAIAAALLASKPAVEQLYDLPKLHAWEATTARIMTELSRVCPRFNVARFRKASGFDRS
jgi:hypothetical protein